MASWRSWMTVSQSAAEASPARPHPAAVPVSVIALLLAKCSLTKRRDSGTPAVRYVFFDAWYLPCAQASRAALVLPLFQTSVPLWYDSMAMYDLAASACQEGAFAVPTVSYGE